MTLVKTKSLRKVTTKMSEDEDLKLARLLQEEFYAELLNNEGHEEIRELLPKTPTKFKGEPSLSIVDPELDVLDPTPDLHALFLQFNGQFFWSRLSGCEVKWSPRMTLCAGVCSYQYRSGFCSIRLSLPLLKLRPRKDLVETLLHEMIHAYLFVTDGNDDHDGHGPAFHSHMFRINKETGTKISVYHNFHDEVDNYRTHWWQCDGPCRQRKPFYGLVKRAMNRAPGPNDRWWSEHLRSCGGTYTKIKEPENYGKNNKKRKKENEPIKGQPDIRSSFNKKSNVNVEGQKSGGSNIFGFGGTSFAPPSGASGSLQNKAQKSGAFVVNPAWKVPKDNSSGGHVIKPLKETTANATKTSPDNHSNVRDKIREVWLNKFDKKQPKQKEVKESDNHVECPICSGKIEASKINQHIDACLGSSSAIDQEKKTIKDEYPCPVCQRAIHKEEMNAHLDYCAAS